MEKISKRIVLVIVITNYFYSNVLLVSISLLITTLILLITRTRVPFIPSFVPLIKRMLHDKLSLLVFGLARVSFLCLVSV